MDYTNKIINGDALKSVKLLPDNSVHCIITSPPYFQLRDYKSKGQIGTEDKLDEYINNLADIFNECKRVLHKSGSMYINIGDTYSKGKNRGQLIGVPWTLAFKLKQDGWILRNELIWNKVSNLPISVEDRYSVNHEQIFFFTQGLDYYFSHENLQRNIEAIKDRKWQRNTHKAFIFLRGEKSDLDINTDEYELSGVNMKSVWTFAPAQSKEDHFAAYSKELVKPCILGSTSEFVCANCNEPLVEDIEKVVTGPSRKLRSDIKSSTYFQEGNSASGYSKRYMKSNGYKPNCKCDSTTKNSVVLDMFGGTGTTGIVAKEFDRDFILIELNPDSSEISKSRFKKELGLEIDIIKGD